MKSQNALGTILIYMALSFVCPAMAETEKTPERPDKAENTAQSEENKETQKQKEKTPRPDFKKLVKDAFATQKSEKRRRW